MPKITKTPFGEMIERTPEEMAEATKPKVEPKVEPPKHDFAPMWGGRKYDKISKKVFSPEEVEIPGSFTFENTIGAGYNPMQFATKETQDKLVKMLHKLCPGAYIAPAILPSEPFMPVEQRIIKMNNIEHNCGGMASMIMFSGWAWFKIWMKQTFESQGVFVDMNLSEEEAWK